MRLSRTLDLLGAETGRPVWLLHHLPLTDSTNTRLLDAAGRGGEWDQPWTVLVADEQSAGRGRNERRWECRAGEGLLFSLRLDVDLGRHSLSLMGHWAALGLVRALANACGGAEIPPRIWWKWPNDVLVEDAGACGKVAGILVQSQVQGSLARVVVGVGVNVGQRDFPMGLRQPARSLVQAGVVVEREALLALVLGELGGVALPATDGGLPADLLDHDVLASRGAWLREGDGWHALRHRHEPDGRLWVDGPSGGQLLAGGGLRIDELTREGVWCSLEA